jgi:SAV_6107-like HEPN
MSDKANSTAQVLLLPLQTTTGSTNTGSTNTGGTTTGGANTTGGTTAGAAVPYRRPSDIHPVLRRAGAPPAALDLLAQAHRGLREARTLDGPLERYAVAHLAALRASAAVLAVRGRPEQNPRKRKRIRSAWEVLPEVAPELAEWAVYYADGAAKRAAAEAGISSAATAREADDLIRNTALFLRMVQRLLALEPAPARPAPGTATDSDPTRMPRTG